MAGAPKGNKNAAIKPGDTRHGFYANAMSEDELKLYDPAMHASLGDEVVVCRIKLNRLLSWMSQDGNEITDGTFHQMDRMIARVGDLEVKRSIIERNAAESGQGNNDDFDRFVDVATRTGAHRTTFKNGKANGKANGSS